MRFVKSHQKTDSFKIKKTYAFTRSSGEFEILCSISGEYFS